MLADILLIIVLVLAAMALIVTEICTPTFGLLGLVAIGALAWAVYICWTISEVLGIVAAIVAVVCTPIFIVIAVKIIPKTPLGRRLALRRARAVPGGGTPEAEDLQRLVGRETTAETLLRPSGTIRIDGRRLVAQSESGLIEKGAAVRIIQAAGTHVIVRKVES